MKLTDALSLKEGLDPNVVKDIVDIAMRSDFGQISGMNKVVEQEWEDLSQLIRYIKEAIPTSTHYLFDTLVSKLDDSLPDTDFSPNLDEIKEYGLPGNVGREFGEKFIKDLIESGKFAELWTAFEATYPELQSKLQSTFGKSNDLLRYIKPGMGGETYRVSSMPEAAAQELDNLLHDVLETLEFISSQNEPPGIEMVKAVVKDFDNTFSDMLAIFTSNTDSDKPLEPYKQTDIGFKENKMKKIKLTEIYASGHKETSISGITAQYKELQLAWRNLEKEQREELLSIYMPHEDISSELLLGEWEYMWDRFPQVANNPDFQEALLAANFGGNGSVNEEEEYTAEDQWDEMNTDEKEDFLTNKLPKNYQHLLFTHSFEQLKSEIPDFEANLNAEIDEGTCGYSVDGEGGDKPAGSHLLKKSDLQERFQKLANIIR